MGPGSAILWNVSTRPERKDAQYLEELRSLAAQVEPTQSLEEIQRWEGSAAAFDATAQKPYRAYSRSYGTGQTDPFAILALVFGILGGVLGVVFGHIAIYRLGHSGDRGDGLAYAGLALGYLSIVVWVIFFWTHAGG